MNMNTQAFNIVASQSTIDWEGRKVTGAHHGTIAIKEGVLFFNDDVLTGGKFVIDTRSIKILDITDLELNTQLKGHLASEDFFSSERYPEATFEISHAEPGPKGTYRIDGELTIKGITQPIGFDAQVNCFDGSVTATGKIIVDRTKYNMKYSSGNFFQNLGDNLIYNDFDLLTSIIAEPVSVELHA
jgi:polyisoprenoid-binding protein YceI